MIDNTKIFERIVKVSKFIMSFLLFGVLLILITLSALLMQSEQQLVIGGMTFLVMFSIPLMIMGVPKIYHAIKYHVYRVRKTPRHQVYSTLSTAVVIIFSIVLFVQVLIFNLFAEAFITFSVMVILVVFFMPNSPKSVRRQLNEDYLQFLLKIENSIFVVDFLMLRTK